MLFELIPHSWQGHLRGEREAINQIGEALRKRADSGEQILPNRAQVFRALELSPENVRVLIVGQDPYPNSVDACGLAFSVAARLSGLPGSLLNIQKEREFVFSAAAYIRNPAHCYAYFHYILYMVLLNSIQYIFEKLKIYIISIFLHK